MIEIYSSLFCIAGSILWLVASTVTPPKWKFDRFWVLAIFFLGFGVAHLVDSYNLLHFVCVPK